MLAIVLNVRAARDNALWQDEVASARVIVERSPVEMVLRVARGESTPPGWYSVMWLFHVLGVPVTDLRLFSAVFAGALAGLVVLYAHRFLPLVGAVLAGVIVALGSQPLQHGWELRSYSLFALVSVAFALLLERAADEVTRGRLVALAACVAVGSFTHYFFGLVVAASLVWLWTAGSFWRVRRQVTAWIGIGLVPFVLWLPAFAKQYGHHRFSWIGPFRARSVVDVYRALFVSHLGGGDARLALRVTVLALVAAGAWLLALRSLDARHCAILATLPVGIAALAWLAGANVFIPRNFVGIAPFAAVSVAAAATALPRVAAVLVAIALAAGVAADALDGRGDPPAAYDRVAAHLVATGWQPRDPILVLGPVYAIRDPVAWYLPGRPDLRIGRPRDGACRRPIYVIARRGLWRRWSRRGSIGQVARFGSLVAGHGGPAILLGPRPPGSHVLGATTGRIACLRLLPR